MRYRLITLSESKELELSETELGKGGEGSIFQVLAHTSSDLPQASSLVAKIYHQSNDKGRLAKVKAMISNPVDSNSVAWPLGLVVDHENNFRGFVMKKLDKSAYQEWLYLAHARERRSKAQKFDVRYGVTAIRNLAVAVDQVHRVGHILGDLNESNISVAANATVFIIDTDSAQVKGADGTVFPCLVGKPEYTAPELQGIAFSDSERTEATDAFAYAVAAYQMLTGGAHPTDATWADAGDPPTVGSKLRAGAYPGLNPAAAPNLGHPARIPTAAIPTAVRGMLLKLLAPQPERRGSLTSAVAVLDGLLPHLRQCGRVKAHWYDYRDGACGWCSHADAGQPDPWAPESGPKLPRQLALPPVEFGDESGGPVVRRAPAQRAGPASPPPPHYGQAPQYGQTPSGNAPAPHLPTPSAYPPGPYPPAGPPQPPQPSAPTKPKGGKSILSYADGTSGPRSSMGVLIRSNPRVALQCAKNETPEIAKFWWPAYRDVAPKAGLLLGLALCTVIAVGWGLALPKLLGSFGWPVWTAPFFDVAAITATAGVAFSALFLTFSGLRDHRKAMKAAKGDVTLLTIESVPKTLLRYFCLGVVYGPLLVAGIVGVIFSLALNVLIGVIQNPSGSGGKYR